MSEENTKVVHVSRAFTLRRNGKDEIKFTAGRNVVDADAADHPYVQAHLTSPAEASTGELEHDLSVAKARIEELEKQLEEKDNEMQAVLNALKVDSGDAKKPKK